MGFEWGKDGGAVEVDCKHHRDRCSEFPDVFRCGLVEFKASCVEHGFQEQVVSMVVVGAG